MPYLVGVQEKASSLLSEHGSAAQDYKHTSEQTTRLLGKCPLDRKD